ncbi:hypothetical protein G6O69_24995 [Pseudenhygromyxa sp. WMMC2535]|uniref:hypothetical protein n=1 Tax=Pseudenhygromyxa sp. WMMC2535 TaxID=2712867 RepID=UPI0015532EC6|nr:hypothetical protein [Pseudenhygromyxa sp. WMMC2535]NVB41121.1 hypothetical protein [Pseudenhygromyxa sp. WMMC2535]
MGQPEATATAAQDHCARCGAAFEGPEDRRAQLRAPDICRACHLDPRARALPLEANRGEGWLGRCARTLVQLIVSPSASFRVVDEPVDHTRVLGFLATLRLPLWLIALALAWAQWFFDDVPGPLARPSVIGEIIGAQFADVLRLWLLLLVPIGLPTLYFFGGILAHIGLALTGGARRSIGASMRAYGLALAPSLLLVGVLDVLTVGLGVPPEVWVFCVGAAVLLAMVLLSVALARTHVTSLIRGVLVALLPALLFAALLTGRGLLEYYRLPFMEAPEIESYAPYPIY